jgi:hypothetical protein
LEGSGVKTTAGAGARRASGVVVAACALLSLWVPESARADGTVCPEPDVCAPNPVGFFFVGAVADRLGRPLEGVTVADETGRSTLTDAAGNYRLDETDWNPATRRTPYAATLLVSKAGTNSVQETAVVGAAGQDKEYDFTLNYHVALGLTPQLDVDPGSVVTATITASAPAPSTVCVPVGLSGQSPELQGSALLVGTDSSGVSTWTFGVQVPADAQAGHWYLVYVDLLDCASGHSLAGADGIHPANQEFRIRS